MGIMEKRSVPIIACSTGIPSNGALAVIRISGIESLEKLSDCFSGNLLELEVRRATLFNIIKEGDVVDNVVVTFFKAPHSYTGENLLEVSVHGNSLNVKRIIEYLSKRAELEPALPGEFTFRAYKNGKLTLTQVEGLELLLRADSPLVLEQGIQLLQGELHERYLRLHKTFLDLKGAVELSIDFLEDMGEETAEKMLKKSFASLRDQTEFLYRRSEGDYGILLSPAVVLVGRTNVGKSSLFNVLLDESRSIVSKKEGTTRDFVSEYVNYKGVHYRLLDTAGIRKSCNTVEKEGIRRSLALLEKAFFKILVVNPFDGEEDSCQIEDGTFDLVVVTHGDKFNFKVPRFPRVPTLYVSLLHGPMGAEDSSHSAGSMGAGDSSHSAGPMGAGDSSHSTGPMGAGDSSHSAGPMGAVVKQDSLREAVWGLVSDKYLRLCEEKPLLLDRHGMTIRVLREKLIEFAQLADIKNRDMGIFASEMQSLEKCIYSLVGGVDSDEILKNIFDNFCIGK